MIVNRPAVLAFSTGIFLALSGGIAFAGGTTIQVSLWDKGPDSVNVDDAHTKMMGKMDQAMMKTASMGIKLDQITIPAGTVTFAVTNDSKDIIHEMILSPLKPNATELPYLPDEYRIDEEKAEHLGEVSELDPGKKGSLTVDLVAGTYIIYCNIPGHFIDGMWTTLTVTP